MTDRRHQLAPTVLTEAANWSELLARVPRQPEGQDALVRPAGHARRLLPASVHDALTDLADDTLADAPGAILFRGTPVGDLPPTPVRPGSATDKGATSEFLLLTVARTLGQPVGYLPEHGGSLIQDLIPTESAATRQTSTSSAAELEFHTETAFHPFRPRYLLLLCLRGDPSARTLLCDLATVLDRIPTAARRVLHEPRFRTGVDESFTHGRTAALRPPAPVLGGDSSRPTMVFDADLMRGTDPEAHDALDVLSSLTRQHRVELCLERGDLLVVDNHRCIHGRSAFTARYDGTDRWVQRSFVVSDLEPSASERRGRIILSTFS